MPPDIDLPQLRRSIEAQTTERNTPKKISQAEDERQRLLQQARADYSYLTGHRSLLRAIKAAALILEKLDPTVFVSVTDPDRVMESMHGDYQVDLNLGWLFRYEGIKGPGGWMESGMEPRLPTWSWKSVSCEAVADDGDITGICFNGEGIRRAAGSRRVTDIAQALDEVAVRPNSHWERVLKDEEKPLGPKSLRNRTFLDYRALPRIRTVSSRPG